MLTLLGTFIRALHEVGSVKQPKPTAGSTKEKLKRFKYKMQKINMHIKKKII